MRDDEVDQVLRAYAERWRSAQVPPPNLAAFGSSGVRRTLPVIGAVAAVLAIMGVAAVLLPEQDKNDSSAVSGPGSSGTPSPPDANVTSTVTASSSPSRSAEPKRCPPVAVRPSYLPWLENGESVPPPEIRTGGPGPESDGTDLSWRAPGETERKPYYVSLRRYTGVASYSGEEVPVFIEREVGRFYEGTVPGHAAIEWGLSGLRCATVTLELYAHPRMTRAEARREIIRIAQSLE